jgi:hypothetical protein
MLADKEEVHIDLWFSAVARDTQAPWTLQMKSREGRPAVDGMSTPPPPFAKRVLEEEQWLRAWQFETTNLICNHTHLRRQMKITTFGD